MRRIYVKLRKDEVEALIRLAEANRRHPSAEAALLLTKAIQRQKERLPGKQREVQPCAS